MASRGINYFSFLNEKYNKREPIPVRYKPRVFISHQKKDSDVANSVAEYLKVVKMVMSIYQLNDLISTVRGISRDSLLLENRTFSENNAYHPLSRIMDSYAPF